MGVGTSIGYCPPVWLAPFTRPAPQTQRRILLADHDDRGRAQLRSALETAGHTVETASTAQSLVDHVRGVTTHLVALALDLPDMTPAVVIERLREVCSPPPIVLLANHGADPRATPLRQSAAACIFKPVDTARFVGICQRVLRLTEQRAAWATRAEPRRAVRLEVQVAVAGCVPIVATLVNLSPNGFQMEMPGRARVGEPLHVSIAIPSSPQVLTFEGRFEWEKPLAQGTLAGGSVLNVGAEDERILAALLYPLD